MTVIKETLVWMFDENHMFDWTHKEIVELLDVAHKEIVELQTFSKQILRKYPSF